MEGPDSKLSALWTQVVVELDARMVRQRDGGSVETLGDIAENIVSAVLAVGRFEDGGTGVARCEARVGPSFPADSSRILVLARAVDELAEDELRAVLIREFFCGFVLYQEGPEHFLEQTREERDEEVDDWMRDLGFEAEADLVESLCGGWRPP